MRSTHQLVGTALCASPPAGSVRVVRRSSEGGEDVVELAPLDLKDAKTTVAKVGVVNCSKRL